jgi:hypothetical protein
VIYNSRDFLLVMCLHWHKISGFFAVESNLKGPRLWPSRLYMKCELTIQLYRNMSSALFTPFRLGTIVLAPLTRSRATKDQVQTDLGVEYYAQRSVFPGSLLITEGTGIHPLPALGSTFHIFTPMPKSRPGRRYVCFSLFVTLSE